ncbi:MAG: ATP-binding cassette domain-containing protein [Gammaproteobacteria bacterium]|nr:ATP-binding cassette domain-containing protein [Gammaproteobacteria bacterium]
MKSIDTSLSTVLRLKNFGASFGDKIILSDVNLNILERGVFVLLGPSGTGKSTLLRSIAGLNETNPSFRTWGNAYYLGKELGDENRPLLVSQSARLMMASIFDNVVHHLSERDNLTLKQQRDLAVRLLEQAGLSELNDALDDSVMSLTLAQQRHLAILRLTAASPKLLCLDEPTTGISDTEAAALLTYIKNESQRRAILIVLHNLEQAKSLSGHTALLAGGYIQEVQDTDNFINSPKSEHAKQWVKLGSCNVPSPDALAENLADDVTPPPPLPTIVQYAPSESFGPRGFLWLKRGLLAGTPLPGVFHDIEYDMQMLKKVGVTTLITLMTKPVNQTVLDKFSVKSIWHSIKDMGAPDNEQAVTICREIDLAINNKEVVAVHCRAGMGRTGTILAAYLIWEGSPALLALDTVRNIEPRWVQSEEQVNFLESFAKYLAKDKHKLQK